MRRLLAAVFSAALLGGCALPQPAGDDVVTGSGAGIRADRETFSPMDSSVVGIGLTPVYTPGKSYKPVEYQWRTNYGYFTAWGKDEEELRELGPDVRREGGRIYWTYDPVDIDQKKPPVEILLRVREKNTQNVLGEASMRLEWTDRDTAVVKRRK
ncbi:MAG: hypothetical protein WC728_12705 [Elusimicrobiota bacterium]